MNLHSIRINRGGVLVLTVVAVIVIYLYSSSSNGNGTFGYASMLRNTDSVNLRNLLIRSIQAAQYGGLEITDVAESRKLNQKSKGKTKEGADDLVTDADQRSHCIMKAMIENMFSSVNIISEEDFGSDYNCKPKLGEYKLDETVLLNDVDSVLDKFVYAKDVTVWIDPLDATQEFTEKLYNYVTTMVCVAVKGVPVIGVIHSPFSGKTSWASVDNAVSEDLAQIQKEKTVNPELIVTVSRSHAGDVKAISKSVFGNNTKILEAAGAGYKVLQVMYNNAAVYIHMTQIKKWDICAGNAILNALGGKMTTLKNEDIEYSSRDSHINNKGLLSALNHQELYINKYMDYMNLH